MSAGDDTIRSLREAVKLSPEVEAGQTASFVEASLALVSARIARRYEELRVCHDDLCVARAEIVEVRRRRAKAATAMSGRLVRLLDLCSALGWRSFFGRAGVSQDPDAMLRQSTRVLMKMRQTPLGTPPGCAIEVDVGALAADFEGGAGELQAALDELQRWEIKAVAAAADRDGAVAGFDDDYAAGVRYAEGLFVLAGCERLVKRLRVGKGRR